MYTKKSNNASLEGYDKQCWRAKQEYHKVSQNYSLYKNSVNFHENIKYEIEMKRVMHNERTNLIKELRKNRSCYSKSYWKILNGPNKICNIPLL